MHFHRFDRTRRPSWDGDGYGRPDSGGHRYRSPQASPPRRDHSYRRDDYADDGGYRRPFASSRDHHHLYRDRNYNYRDESPPAPPSYRRRSDDDRGDHYHRGHYDRRSSPLTKRYY